MCSQSNCTKHIPSIIDYNHFYKTNMIPFHLVQNRELNRLMSPTVNMQWNQRQYEKSV